MGGMLLPLLALIVGVLPSTQPASSPPATRPAPPPGWKLVWSDEFEKGAAPDPNSWRYESGYLRNHEAQYYTKDRRENVRIEDGNLVIEARKERIPVAGKPDQFTTITSGSIVTTGPNAQWKYG